MGKQNGITLVSLVVTIIVLIILAGISINILIGQNGIITRAQQAKENTILAQEEELKNLNELYSQLDNMGDNNGSTGDINSEALQKLTEFKSAIATAISNEGVNTLETDSVEIMVGNIGKILQERTKDATATADNISEGKTAWVNGELITGNGNDVNSAYNAGKESKMVTVLDNIEASLSNGYAYFSINSLYSEYANLTIDNIHVECCGLITGNTGAGRQSADGMSIYIWEFSYDPSNGIISVRTSDSTARNYAQVKANIIIIK